MATVVRFVGGPFAGQAERQTIDSDPLRAGGAIMAEMANQDYAAHPVPFNHRMMEAMDQGIW